jgi:hypothetical protein
VLAFLLPDAGTNGVLCFLLRVVVWEEEEEEDRSNVLFFSDLLLNLTHVCFSSPGFNTTMEAGIFFWGRGTIEGGFRRGCSFCSREGRRLGVLPPK